jgi:hypothetical protein
VFCFCGHSSTHTESNLSAGVIGTGEGAANRQCAHYLADHLHQGLFLGTATALQNGGK